MQPRSWRGTQCPFPVLSPHEGGTSQARRYDAHQMNHKGNRPPPPPHCSGADAMKEGGGESSGCSSPSSPSSSASTLHYCPLSLRSRSSHSGTSLRASSLAGAGTGHPWWRESPVPTGCASIVKEGLDREPAPLPLPVSFRTSALRIFCWAAGSTHLRARSPESGVLSCCERQAASCVRLHSTTDKIRTSFADRQPLRAATAVDVDEHVPVIHISQRLEDATERR